METCSITIFKTQIFSKNPTAESQLDIEEIKTLPEIPFSHPFIERLIGLIRQEYLNKILFWNAQDL